MNDMKTVIKEFIAVQEAMLQDYPEGEAVCHMLHKDLGLGSTPREDAEEVADKVGEVLGEEVSPDELDMSIEHHELHLWLRSASIQMAAMGMTPDQMLGVMFAIGRRWGMKEAAGDLSATTTTDALQQWLRGIGDIEDNPNNTTND